MGKGPTRLMVVVGAVTATEPSGNVLETALVRRGTGLEESLVILVVVEEESDRPRWSEKGGDELEGIN